MCENLFRDTEVVRHGDLQIGFGPRDGDDVDPRRPRNGDIICLAGSGGLIGAENGTAPKSLGGLRPPEILPIRSSCDRAVASNVAKRVMDRKCEKHTVIPLQFVQEDSIDTGSGNGRAPS